MYACMHDMLSKIWQRRVKREQMKARKEGKV